MIPGTLKLRKTRRSNAITTSLAVLITMTVMGALGSACSVPSTDDPPDQVVETGRQAGLDPYWLGDGFAVVGKMVHLGQDADFYGPDKPIVALHYWLEGAQGTATVSTYSETQSDWERYFVAARRVQGTSIESVQVGDWTAELWQVPSPSREVTSTIYVFRFDGMVVIATAKASSTGDPATDLNPLIDAELWAQVLEEHLRPYPE